MARTFSQEEVEVKLREVEAATLEKFMAAVKKCRDERGAENVYDFLPEYLPSAGKALAERIQDERIEATREENALWLAALNGGLDKVHRCSIAVLDHDARLLEPMESLPDKWKTHEWQDSQQNDARYTEEICADELRATIQAAKEK